ncbi:MAG TPA: YicC family protein [Candidatus Merdicola faecigallinarum]|uniref:YicC family protein n=1 Tax=Candidatus Merdicola faecigallinarum TaxID=2840862 RepID=A0A9D1S974_9FIRM|nr:YicC family protein [Candidatus Merdicola faecigallinarum]
MIRSMTGYGRAKYEKEGREYQVEIKSVNHKYIDLNVKIPYQLSFLEENIKKLVVEKVKRGKIDIAITFLNQSSLGKSIHINQELIQEYVKELKKVAKENEIIDDISIMKLIRLPDAFTVQNDENETVIWDELIFPLTEAIDCFVEMKKLEGKKLAEDILKRIELIYSHILEISDHSTRLIDEYIVKLKTRLNEILQAGVVDESRLAQEVVIYADKSSIEEEITRLKSHIDQIKGLLEQKEEIAIGKKMDFIIQEMNREINTIGSKSNCLEITNLVIQVKTELENVREQIQNVE